MRFLSPHAVLEDEQFSDLLKVEGASAAATSEVPADLFTTQPASAATDRRFDGLPLAPASLEELADEGPAADLAVRIIREAVQSRASDVHIEPWENHVWIRFRVDGALNDAHQISVEAGRSLVNRIKILANMNAVERRRPQDGQLSVDVGSSRVNVRVATIATVIGEKCVLRILDGSHSLRAPEDLGMSPTTAEAFGQLVRSPFGMVLCAGPTGSGKTTTLYAALGTVANASCNVMTIEDPVEYRFDGINQVQVNEQAGITFATGLRSILRQDPDIILVGEIRDAETARIATQAALTGHLVLSSVHASDAASALHRFLDMGIEAFLVAPSLIAVIGQRLLRKICDNCKVPTRPMDAERSFYEACGGNPLATVARGAGCKVCANTGYRGRVGVYEVLRVTTEIRDLVIGHRSQDEIRRTACNQGMRSMQEAAIDLVADGTTTIAEAMRTLYSSSGEFS